MRRTGGFGAPEEWLFPWEQHLQPGRLAQPVSPAPATAGCRPPTEAQVLAGMGAEVDAAGGSFTMGFTTARRHHARGAVTRLTGPPD